MWEGNKSQVGSLESIILDEAKQIFWCSSKNCNEAVIIYKTRHGLRHIAEP